MRIAQPLQNQHGSSILLVLLVAGLGILIVMSTLQSQADFSYKALKLGRTFKNDVTALKVTLNFTLNSYAGCLVNFQNQVISSGSVVSVNQINYLNESGGAGDVIIDVDSSQKRQFGRTVVDLMYLEPDPEKFGPDGAGHHLAQLKIVFSDDRTLMIPIYVTTDSLGRILGCHSTSFVEENADGEKQTFEEKLCSMSSIPDQTSDWKNNDCIECLGGSVPLRDCVNCKQKGMSFDPIAKSCI